MTQVSNISQPESIPVNRYYSQQASSLVIIDASVDNLEILKAGLKPGAEVVVLHPQLNGIEQITTLVSRRKNLQKVHLVSHGSAGSIKLGACELNSNNIKDYSTQIQSWFGNLGDRSLYIYGCQVALGNEGQSFVRELHNLTGAGIAAATKKVGSSEDGGVWLLDYKVGNIDSEIVFTDEVVRTYLGTFMEEDGEVVPESELIVAESLTEEPLGENLLAEVAPEAETASDESVIELIEADSAAEELFAEIADAEAARDIEASDELEVPIDVETAIELEEIASESDVVEPVVAGVPGAEVPIDVETAIELEEIASESDVVEPVVAGDPLAEDSIELETAIDETVIEPTVEEFVVTGDPLAEDSIELETAIEETVIEPTVEEFVVTGDPLAEDSIEVETAIDEVVEADSIEEDTELNEPAVVEPGVVASIPEGEAPIEIETAIEESVVEPFTEEDSAIEQAVAGVPFGEAVEIETAIEQPVIEPAVVEPAVVEEIAGIPVVVEPAVVEDSFIEPLVVDAPEVAANDLIDLSAVAQGDTVLTEFSVTREAGFNNTVDFYEVNADGSVVDPESGETIAVGEAGYTEAALTNRIGLELATENGEISKFSAELEGGNFYAPILAVETGFDALSDSDPNNDPTVYFTYSDANNDGFDHVINSAPNVFEFEDIANGGDQDFNDLIVAASFGDTSAEQVPAVAPLVNEPAIEPLVEPPVVELPVGAPEVLDEPVVEEPAVVPPINQPVIEEPPVGVPEAIDEPVVEQPAVVPPINQPVIEEPPFDAPEVLDEPVVEEPAVVPPINQPVVEEPPVGGLQGFDEPVVEEPAVVPPINQPVVEEPPVGGLQGFDEPVVEEPAVVPPINQPVIEEPPFDAPEAIDEPVVEEPAVVPPINQPVVEEPPVGGLQGFDEPVVEEPAVVPPINQPVIEEPPFDAPEVLDEPVVEEPAVVPPINQPVIEEPPVGAPEAIDEPVVEEPAVVPPVVEPPVVEPETLDEPAIEPTDESVSEVPIEESSTTNTIDGVEIQLGQFAPNLETPVTEPLTAVIGDDVEFSFGETESDDITGEPTSSQIDIISGAPGQASIVYQIGSSQPEDTFDAAEFNGLVFGDSSGDLPPIENVTLNESVTTIGLDSSDVIFSEDLIAINFESVTLEPGLTARFDIDFADA